MQNMDAINEIKILEKEYERKYGIFVDYVALPQYITDEKLCLILRQMVKTGDSIMVTYGKMKDIIRNIKYIPNSETKSTKL